MRVPVRLAIATCFGSMLLSACTQHIFLLSPDFGVAVGQDVTAQVADPDANYRGVPTPGSNGARASLAQFRYLRNQVIQPATTATTQSIPVEVVAAPVLPPPLQLARALDLPDRGGRTPNANRLEQMVLSLEFVEY